MISGAYSQLGYDTGESTPGGPHTPITSQGYEESTVEAGLDTIMSTVNEVVHQGKVFEAGEVAETRSANAAAEAESHAQVCIGCACCSCLLSKVRMLVLQVHFESCSLGLCAVRICPCLFVSVRVCCPCRFSSHAGHWTMFRPGD